MANFWETPEFKRQSAEFDAVAALARRWEHQPAIVDDAYPEWRFNYERDLFDLIKKVRLNHGEETFNIRSRP
jgi:hypothetical protein